MANGKIKKKGGAEVVTLPCSGSTVSVRDLYRSYWIDLCKYVNRTFGKGPPEPEDVAQVAFANYVAHKNPATVKNPRAFLYRSAHNYVISYHRRAAAHKKYIWARKATAVEDARDDFNPERILAAREQLDVIEIALWKMPKKRRRIVMMHRFDKLTIAEISRRLTVSETGVRRELDRGIADIQKEFLHGQD